jgi:hypothetical protein
LVADFLFRAVSQPKFSKMAAFRGLPNRQRDGAAMTTTYDSQELFEQCIGIVSRVVREGGIGHVQIPDPGTGALATVEIDQDRALELLSALIDNHIGNMWKRIRDGQTLSPNEREALKLWTAVTVAEMGDAERDHRAAAHVRRAQLYLVESDKP